MSSIEACGGRNERDDGNAQNTAKKITKLKDAEDKRQSGSLFSGRSLCWEHNGCKINDLDMGGNLAGQ